jgi:hypothetical protein
MIGKIVARETRARVGDWSATRHASGEAIRLRISIPLPGWSPVLIKSGPDSSFFL